MVIAQRRPRVQRVQTSECRVSEGPLSRPQRLIVDKEARPADLRPFPGTAVPALTGS
ncbi:hypothetical protein [Streptosporangium subroseum]|uniref:hypothetical protein n=1 Tax=Streptosporangium subroseum TaxID=106412 RepID=UPI00308E4BC1|nr:hypothetical protein OHB15_16295 [Streptosporangium subroseum]